MTTTDFPERASVGANRAIPRLVPTWWRSVLRRRRERRMIVALSRRAPHVIRDMGFDPERVYAALDGSWDEVDPALRRPFDGA